MRAGRWRSRSRLRSHGCWRNEVARSTKRWRSPSRRTSSARHLYDGRARVGVLPGRQNSRRARRIARGVAHREAWTVGFGVMRRLIEEGNEVHGTVQVRDVDYGCECELLTRRGGSLRARRVHRSREAPSSHGYLKANRATALWREARAVRQGPRRPFRPTQCVAQRRAPA